jgi:hypothetical protein
MFKKINSASRLNAVLSQAAGMADSVAALTIWSSIFPIQEPNDVRKALRVSERLQWLFQELEILRSQMRAKNFSEELYTSAFNRIEQAISPLGLLAAWSSVKQHLAPETLIVLGFCTELLPDEESQIDPKELDDVRYQVQELEGLLEASSLPDGLKALIRHHIELIRRALDQYPIAGAKALREAARTALGELVEVRDTVRESSKTEEVSKLGAIWKKINDISDVAIKADKVAKIGTKAWALLENLFGG